MVAAVLVGVFRVELRAFSMEVLCDAGLDKADVVEYPFQAAPELLAQLGGLVFREQSRLPGRVGTAVAGGFEVLCSRVAVDTEGYPLVRFVPVLPAEIPPFADIAKHGLRVSQFVAFRRSFVRSPSSRVLDFGQFVGL